ncbi:glutathione S-transferase [Periconia macrospinosa]|uniref:Glutathione S-transferase n=1 Tax=Periconia macrospinosa TaxID=97972 RepID=A0A2V1DZ44_9PLEO|nr:glutathione S-transferase [Periconia macrospinosa]
MAPFGTLYTTTKLHHARVTKILAAANLNGLEILVDPNFTFPGDNNSAEYKEKFPLGKIPAFETPSGLYLAEGIAITHYVCDAGPRREQLLGGTAEKRALVQMWVSFAEIELFANMGPILMAIKDKKFISEVVEEREKHFRRALDRVEQQLAQEGSLWLVHGSELSLADLSVAAALYWPLALFMDEEYRNGCPKTMEWLERLMAVDGVGEAFKAPLNLCKERPDLNGGAAVSF